MYSPIAGFKVPRVFRSLRKVCGVSLSRGVRSAFLAVWVLWGCGSAVGAEEQACRDGYARLSSLPVVQAPKRVLLVPLLRRQPESNENERWPESPAASVAAFYRSHFGAEVVWLREVRIWRDFYRQAAALSQRANSFDRVIFIGHGGFDGPVLNDDVLGQNITATGSEGQVLRSIEAQPGVHRFTSIHYDVSRNREFSDYLASRWQELLGKDEAEIRRLLGGLEEQLQPPDQACMQRHCSPGQLAAVWDEAARETRLEACKSVCRDPLFVFRSGEEPVPERFVLFVDSLRALARVDGLIFFGACNPGTAVAEKPEPWEGKGVLIHTALAGGPHDSYASLIAAATGRGVAGPVGKSSATDIVRQLVGLEKNYSQRRLCIVAPPASHLP